MSAVRQFAKCAICGTRGHSGNHCPVGDYNRQLEARGREKITAKMLFPGQPDLVRKLELRQEYWKRAFANG